ncbi:hypothetical protein FA15DRAFT_706032 [Coprinopsis marcescibilis]|uniref:Uncharacterized protein n=1 Tax=Coprinopsis marcescibilis TaxID=230819 RepID=A0A5C3KRJ1_COPMA|nr:hypothetical protein FA15DRAFT_706032 [Coprinopsis marcescibilis]
MALAMISPQKLSKTKSIDALLSKEPKTKLEKELHNALEEEHARSQYWKTRAMHLQLTLVLQQIYCRWVRNQLKMKEAKGAKKSNQKLKNPNLGKVITDDDFFNKVKLQREAEEAAKQAKAQRKSAEELLVEVLVVWKEEEAERAAKNNQRKEEWEAAKAAWKEEKDQAKSAGTRVKDWILTHPEPKQADPSYCNIPKAP